MVFGASPLSDSTTAKVTASHLFREGAWFEFSIDKIAPRTTSSESAAKASRVWNDFPTGWATTVHEKTNSKQSPTLVIVPIRDAPAPSGDATAGGPPPPTNKPT